MSSHPGGALKFGFNMDHELQLDHESQVALMCSSYAPQANVLCQPKVNRPQKAQIWPFRLNVEMPLFVPAATAL